VTLTQPIALHAAASVPIQEMTPASTSPPRGIEHPKVEITKTNHEHEQ